MSQLIDPVFSSYSIQELIERLSPLVTPKRYDRMKQVTLQRLDHLAVATEGIWDIHNALAIVRTAEALGIDHVNLVDCDYKRGKGRQTMRGSHGWINVRSFDQTPLFVQALRNEGWKIAGACPRASLTLGELPVDEKICLVLGNENRGLSNEMRLACDYHYQIPMFGMVESLNLSVAGAISLYELAARKRKECRLVKEPLATETRLARFLINSLGGPARTLKILTHLSANQAASKSGSQQIRPELR